MNPAAPMVYCGPERRFRVRVAPELVLSDEEHDVLDELIGSKLTSVRLALRARIALLAAQGLQNKDIALALGVGRIKVSGDPLFVQKLEDIVGPYMSPPGVNSAPPPGKPSITASASSRWVWQSVAVSACSMVASSRKT